MLQIQANEITMTSLELVEFINNQRINEDEPVLLHKNFLAKVPQVLGEETSAKFSADLPDAYGRPRKGYKFPKREACLMAMSYSYDLQAKVFDKMSALESKKLSLPSYSEALRKLADTIEDNQNLQATISVQTPKVQALDRIANADGMYGLQAAGKILQQQPNKFIQWLRSEGWIYKRPGGKTNYPYSDKSNAGYMTTKAVIIQRPDGSDEVREQAMVTPKGLEKLALMLGVVSVGEAV